MKAIRSDSTSVRAAHMPRPEGAGRRIRVTSAGICGTDLRALARGGRSVVLGHEFGGVLDDGTLVAVQPNIPCGTCPRCIRGDGHICSSSHQNFYGVTRDGGMAEEVIVDERCVVRVPPGVGADALALVEPLAVAVHAVNRSEVAEGDRALVVGAGSIGLLCSAVMRARGVEVDIAARHPHQRRVATALGLRASVSAEYPVVVDAAGTSASFEMAITAAQWGGQLVLVALPEPSMTMPNALVLKEIRIQPAVLYSHFGGEHEFMQAATLLAADPQLASLLVTHRFGLDDAQEAFRVASDRRSGAIKVHLLPT